MLFRTQGIKVSPTDARRSTCRSSRSISTKKIPIELLRILPKAELHCHLDGCVRPATIIDISKEKNISIPSMDTIKLGEILSVGGKVGSLVEYLKAFDITLSVMQDSDSITRIMYEVCEDAVADGVKYLEVRFSPILHLEKGLTMTQVLEAVLDGCWQANFNLPIVSRVLVCGMRQLPPEVTEKIAEIAWRYKEKGVVGFDLAGPEKGFSSKIHKSAFDLVRNKLLNCTLHSGEAAGWESISDSIHFCGHGVHLAENPTLEKYCAEQPIPIEICLTSNADTRAVPDLTKHPLRRFFDNGIMTVICTDNSTMSNTNLSREFQVAQETQNFTPSEILRLITYGFSANFLSGKPKQVLRKQSIEKAATLLLEHGYTQIETELKLPLYQPFDLSIGKICHPTAKPPLITTEILRKLPKTDLNCRFEGSISVEKLWEFYQKDPSQISIKFDVPMVSKDEFDSIFSPPAQWNLEWEKKPKVVMKELTKLRENITSGLEDIVAQAAKDNVKYMEISVRPNSHLGKHFNQGEDVLSHMLREIKYLEKKYSIHANLIVFASPAEDDPVGTLNTAKLAIKYRDQGVAAFGILGSEIPTQDYDYFKSAFELLKTNHMNVLIGCGRTDPENVIRAVQIGGAQRISGGFILHKHPELMDYLSNVRNIGVEFGNTPNLEFRTKQWTQIAGSPMRYFADSKVPIALCSFHKTLNWERDRIQLLNHFVQESNLSPRETIELLHVGFDQSFQDVKSKANYGQQLWNCWKEIFQSPIN